MGVPGLWKYTLANAYRVNTPLAIACHLFVYITVGVTPILWIIYWNANTNMIVKTFTHMYKQIKTYLQFQDQITGQMPKQTLQHPWRWWVDLIQWLLKQVCFRSLGQSSPLWNKFLLCLKTTYQYSFIPKKQQLRVILKSKELKILYSRNRNSSISWIQVLRRIGQSSLSNGSEILLYNNNSRSSFTSFHDYLL